MNTRISELENVIITESFSKWVGLSGLRVGFIYSNDDSFEFYGGNVIIEKLLSFQSF